MTTQYIVCDQPGGHPDISRFADDADVLTNDALRSLRKRFTDDITWRFKRKGIITPWDGENVRGFRECAPKLTNEGARKKALRMIAQLEFVEQLLDWRHWKSTGEELRELWFPDGEPVDPRKCLKQTSGANAGE